MRRAFPCLAAVWTAVASAAPSASVELLPQTQAQGDAVLLGQVARVRSADLEMIRRLVHLPVGRAPQAGQVAVLKQEALALWIRRQTGLGPAEVEVHGAREAQVTAGAGGVQGEEIGRAAAEAMRVWLAARAVDAGVQVRVMPRDLHVRGDGLRLEARPIDQAVPRRHMVVWVDVWSAGILARTQPVSLELVGLDGAAAIAHAPLAERLDPPFVAVRAREAIAVLRGEWATLRSVNGPVVLETAVEVLQDGRTGDKVRVRQQGARALVMARVVGPGQVEVAP